MMFMRSIALSTTVLASLSAADLNTELATWGPVSTGHTSAETGVWFVEANTVATTRMRLNGLSAIARDGLGVDGQVYAGRLWDRSDNLGNQGRGYNLFSGPFTYYRTQLRAGSDPLAEQAGQFFATVSGSIHLPYALSLQAEAGRSQERGLLVSGEASLLFVRVRAEHDDHVDTVRVGTGPRILGTTAPWAWGVMVDWASTQVDLTNGLDRSTEGAIGQIFVMYRYDNRWLIGTSFTGATAVIDRNDARGHESGQVEAAATFGITF